jgi:Rieske Fe-S protein
VTDTPVDPPKWRRDFPYTSSGEDDVTRREFTRYLVLASGAFATGTVAVAVWSSLRPINHGKPQPIVRLEDVPVNGTHLFGYPTKDDPAILVRLPGDRLHAMSQKCTHLSCVVYYEPDKQRMVCPCHEGVFDARSGEVLEGPPQRPLGRIDVEVRNGTIWALGAEPS